jgi:magnesium transporter
MLRLYTRDTGRFVAEEVTTYHQLPSLKAPTWFDLLSPSAEQDRFIERSLGISIPTREEMEEIESSARLYTEDGAEFMTITVLTDLDSDDPSRTPITFVLKGANLVTVRYADPRPFRNFTVYAQKANGSIFSSGERVMFGILEALIDRLADALERAGSEIDTISREVFRNKAAKSSRKTQDLQSVIEQIGRKGDLLTMARESLVSMTRLFTYHQAVGNDIVKPTKDARVKLKTLQRDVLSLSDHATFLSNKLNFLLDATLGLINLEQNRIIKIFSVAAVVFLPPTLVASIYGMNFEFMPELKWMIGYPWALGLMVLSAILPYGYFKHRGWL